MFYLIIMQWIYGQLNAEEMELNVQDKMFMTLTHMLMGMDVNMNLNIYKEKDEEDSITTSCCFSISWVW